MVRGIERGDIFLNDADREQFCARLSRLLEETGMECLAWALIPNHFHLLLRPRQTSLAKFMRRLLTGYAVTFNQRRNRSGHLFQNRYKSIVCEEEEYLLELVRYIHLNPLRAGLVRSMEELDRYPWTGHAVLMGHKKMSGQAVNEVLARFGKKKKEARKAYREFVQAGIAQGKRAELTGGGLRRSLAFLGKGEKPESPGCYDERILGTGEFVERLWQEEGLKEKVRPRLSLKELIERVAGYYEVETQRVLRRSTAGPTTAARSVICFYAVEKMGYKGTEVGKVLGLGRSGVTRAVARGRKLEADSPDLSEKILARNE